MTAKHKVYVYGTLRPTTDNTVKVAARLYDLGWYPGIILSTDPTNSSFVDCEIIEVDDEGLSRLDVYEGYYPEDHSASLYIRRPYLDGFIYEYNRVVNEDKRIHESDWVKFNEGKKALSKEFA